MHSAPPQDGVTAEVRDATEHAPTEVRERIVQLLARGDATAARQAALDAADRYASDVEINVLCGTACLAAGDAEGALDAFHLAAHYDPAARVR